MQKQNLVEGNSQDIKAIVLVEVENVVMHRLLNKEKTLFTSGTCKVASIQNSRGGPAYFLNLGGLYYGISHQTYFVKIEYNDTVSYVFPHFENGLSAISIEKHAPQITLLDQTLAASATVYQVKEALSHAIIGKVIEDHYPTLQKEQIYYPDNIKKVIAVSGQYINSAFSYLGAALQTGVSTVGNYINSKVAQNQQPLELQQQTKQKWQNIKLKATNFIKVSGEFANTLINPIINKTKEITHDINQKIENSESDSVKYAKGSVCDILEIAQASGKAFDEALDGLLKGGAIVTKELQEQGKKLITKKYGEQVIKAIVEGEKVEQIQGQASGVSVQMISEKKPEQTTGQNKPVQIMGQKKSEQSTTSKIEYPSLE